MVDLIVPPPPATAHSGEVGATGISVIVVTHESVFDVGACLSSIRRHASDLSPEVVVVDNASTDGTAQLVANRFPEVRLIRSTRRQGFATNCNLGATISTGRTLVFLNPDARLGPGALQRLVEFVDAHPEVAVAGPRLVYPDGSAQPSARRFPSPVATVIRRTPLRWAMRHSRAERRHLMLDAELDEPTTVDWVLGATVAIPAEVFDSLGGMDDGYRLYCEDIDLCRRAWDEGRCVAYVPDAVVEHRLSELTRRRFLTRATLWHGRGMARFVRRHGIRPRPVGMQHRRFAPEAGQV
jgi:GT2 family glycosyltransferase